MEKQKAFNVRMSHELWYFLRKTAFDQERPMNDIVITLLNKYKKYLEKKLTEDDSMV
jgi:predicted HicB family RNase H-like nuclease